MFGRVVVITASYNNGKLLRGLYNSLLNQTNKNFKWIIVDDGSEDKTEYIVESFQKTKLLDIRYIKKQNGGKSSALNCAFNEIQNDDFVIIVDSDEQLFPNAIEIIDTYMKNSRSDIGAIHFYPHLAGAELRRDNQRLGHRPARPAGRGAGRGVRAADLSVLLHRPPVPPQAHPVRCAVLLCHQRRARDGCSHVHHRAEQL